MESLHPGDRTLDKFHFSHTFRICVRDASLSEQSTFEKIETIRYFSEYHGVEGVL